MRPRAGLGAEVDGVDLWPHEHDGGPMVFRRRAFAPRPAAEVRAELTVLFLEQPVWTGNKPLAWRWLQAKQELMVIEAWEHMEAEGAER